MYLLVWGNNIYGHNTDENNPDSMENMSVGTFMQKKTIACESDTPPTINFILNLTDSFNKKQLWGKQCICWNILNHFS